MSYQIQLREGTAATWTSANPVLAQGEEGHETDTGKRKVGDGSTAWNSLPYWPGVALIGAAPLASPAFTGTPTAPTASALTSTTQVATTAYADSAVAVEAARAGAAEALRAPLASPALTGSPTAPTQTTGDSSAKIATDAFVTTAVATETSRAQTAEALLAPKASPAFTGTVTVPSTVNATDAAQKAYVDSVAAGLNAKPSVTALAASNITLSGPQTVDGTAVTAGQRVLATGQTAASQNGLWVVASGAWTRPADFASGSTQLGAFAFVEAGTANGSSGWVLVGATAVTVDTSSQTWTQFSGAGEVSAGTGLSKSGNTLSNTGVLSVSAADGSVTVSGTAGAPAVSALGAQAAAIAASLPTLAQASVSAPGTRALNTVTTVTAATALTMTLPASTTGALIVVERESASVANVAVTGNIRGVAAQTVTLQLASESEMFFGYGASWWPLAGHKTLASLQALFAAFAGDVAGGVPAVPRVQLSDPSGGAWGLGVSDSAGHLMTLQLVQDQSGNPLQDQSGQPLGMPDTLTVGTPSKPYGLAVGQGGCTVPVGLAGHYDDDYQMSSDTSLSASYRQFWPLSDPQCGTVLPVFAWPLGNPSDMDGTGPLTVACSVECDDGTVLPFYFGGSRTFTLTAQDGRLVTADYPVAFGKQAAAAGYNNLGTLSGVWLRVYASQSASRSDSVTTANGSPTVADASILAADLNRNVSGTGIPGNCRVGTPLTPGTSFTLVQAGTSYATVNATASGTVTADISNIIPLNIGADFAVGSAWNGPNGADLTPQGTAWSGNTSFGGAYGPVLLLGRPPASRMPIVAQISDSIFNGTTDAFLGPVQRGAIALGYPLVKLSRFSAFAGDWSTTVGCRYRRKLVPGCTHAVVELGTNDGLQSMGSATGLQTKILAIGAWLSALGVKAWLCTVCPRSTSTDNWATLANQTITYPASVLSYFNSWVRSVPAGYAGYIELGNLVSSAADSGKWAVNGTANYSSADGTHPSSAFMTGPIAAAVLSAMSAWTVV